jgi:16S rRNA G966 N2-methylase RsmD
MQIECDIVKQKDFWIQEALKFSKPKSINGKFRVMVIDPPYDNTGCKLGYLKLKDKEWIEAINFNELIDDGFIFIWVTSKKGTKISKYMSRIGWAECE